MRARSASVTMLLVFAMACARRAELPPPEDPTASADMQGPETTPDDESASQSDPLDDLGGSATPPADARPEPLEVTVDAVMTAKKGGSTVIMVGADPRFTMHMRIEAVEPETPLLPPGDYAIVIHSPSKTFVGPVPGKGEHVRFQLSIFPENPDDPHDETFFASLWVERR